MLKNKKAFSLLEVLVALFVLSMVTLVYMNSSTIFLGTQKDIIQAERKDQLNDLILQDIMEYASQKNDQNLDRKQDGRNAPLGSDRRNAQASWGDYRGVRKLRQRRFAVRCRDLLLRSWHLWLGVRHAVLSPLRGGRRI